MVKSTAPPKGQRSIASFIFKKTTNDPKPSDEAGPSAAPSSDKELLNAPDKVNPAHRTPEEPPSKRSRTDAQPPTTASQPPAPRPRTTTPPNAEERHQKWQNKLVGDESAGMQRVRTQEALVKRGEPPQKMTPLELQVADLQRKVRTRRCLFHILDVLVNTLKWINIPLKQNIINSQLPFLYHLCTAAS